MSLADAGFKLEEMRPGIDGPTLLLRQMLNAPQKLESFFTRLSLYNLVVNYFGYIFQLSHQEIISLNFSLQDRSVSAQ